jgi:hypothetical protein
LPDIFFVLGESDVRAGWPCRIRSHGVSPTSTEKSFLIQFQPPIMTVHAPDTMGAPHDAVSPTRAAGRLPIVTVMLPIAIGVGG